MHLLDYLMSPAWLLVIGIVSVARFTRLVTHDSWPPFERLRPKVAEKLGGWAELVICPFCAAPYLVAGQMIWFALAYELCSTRTFMWVWLVPNLWWALAYVAAIIVAYDQPD